MIKANKGNDQGNENFKLAIQCTIDLENYIDMTFDMDPYANNLYHDVCTGMIDSVIHHTFKINFTR